jgi:hypothetical protein
MLNSLLFSILATHNSYEPPKDPTAKEKIKQEETERTSSFRSPQGPLSGTAKQEKFSRIWSWKASAMWPPREVEGAGEMPGLPHPLIGLLGPLRKGKRGKTVGFGSN